MPPHLYILFIAIAFIFSLSSFRLNYPLHLRVLSLLLGIDLLAECLAVFGGAKLFHLKNNLPIYNFFLLIEFWMYAFYFKKIITSGLIKRAINFFLILYPFFWIITVYFLFGIDRWNSYIIIVGSCTTILLSAAYYYELFNSPKLIHLSKHPEFWIATALIIFYACNLPYMGMFNFLTKNYSDLAYDLLIVLRILNIVMYSLFAYAYLCTIITRKYL